MLLLLLLFSVYLFSYSFCIHYHSPLCILTCYNCFLVTKDDLVLSLFHTVRESLSTSHTSQTTLSSMYFFHCCCSLSLSLFLPLCWFLPASNRTREKERYYKSAQRVDKLFYTLEYVCMCVFFLLRIRSFFFTYYQFSPSLLHFVTDKWK
jgi:hypothetical protein